jgi:hypothetical protein
MPDTFDLPGGTGMMLGSSTDLGMLLTRVHPEYAHNLPHWKFFKETYEGGRQWFDCNIFKYIKEGCDEYKERLERAYRFNHTREVVDLVNKYIFKAEISRKEDAEDYVKKFWSNATLQRRDITSFMTIASAMSSIYGRVWVVVDNNTPAGVVTQAQAKTADARTYCYTVPPQDVLDLSFNLDDGELNWIKIREYHRDDTDPFAYSGLIHQKIRLWTRNEWFLYSLDNVTYGVSSKFELEESGVHDLGIVPVTHLDHHETENPYVSTPLIADIAYLDRAAANYLSNLDAIIQDQTFSQLVIPAEALAFSDNEENNLGQKLLEFGTKRIFLYSGEANNTPEFISPDPKQAQVILEMVNKIIGEIYHSVGMAGERTKQDNAMGIDNSSGVAKAYDFERMNAMLATKAQALEFCENRLVRIVKAWNGEDVDIEDVQDYVHYSRDFDVRNLGSELDIANNLAIIDAPKALRKEQMTTLVEKLYPHLAQKVKDGIVKDINDNWLELPSAEELTTMGIAKTAIGSVRGIIQSGGQTPPGKSAPSSGGKTGSQGQNNKK